ncbi:Uma2 family endonuclease [Sphingomonas sp.]|uniref:Uma2 family endonuclease n=1 Tax=Sphingomonas sp. TaxID=28214 RepID=UPI003CC5AE76
MTAQLPISTDVQRANLTARDFWTLTEAGAFEGFAKTELIEGEIWVANSVWAWHAKTTAFFTIELGFALRALASDLIVYTSGSVDMADDSVPEPDVSVGVDHPERTGLPLDKPALAVEVSDSTLKNDLGRKARLYARCGVREYWVVDANGRMVHQMWGPSGDTYAERRQVPFGEPLASATIAGLKVPTKALSQ